VIKNPLAQDSLGSLVKAISKQLKLSKLLLTKIVICFSDKKIPRGLIPRGSPGQGCTQAVVH